MACKPPHSSQIKDFTSNDDTPFSRLLQLLFGRRPLEATMREAYSLDR